MGKVIPLAWRPVAVGQLIADSNTYEDGGVSLPYRVTYKCGEGDWVANFEGSLLKRGTLDEVLAACNEADRHEDDVVFVAINHNRDHETELIGVADTPEGAVSLLEKHRREPLRLDEDFCVNNYPAKGPPDAVGRVWREVVKRATTVKEAVDG